MEINWLLLLAIASLWWNCASASAPMSVSYNQKYVQAYRIVVDTSPYFNKTNAGLWNPLVTSYYSLAFNNSFGSISQFDFAFSLNSINYIYPSSPARIQFTCFPNNFTSSSL